MARKTGKGSENGANVSYEAQLRQMADVFLAGRFDLMVLSSAQGDHGMGM